VYVAAGALLTLVTMGLCISNAISAQQAIGLALPAAVATLGGWIGMVVPDAWIAWRRGFQQGCKIASGGPPLPSRASPDGISQSNGDSAVTDLVARCGTRSGRRTQPSDRY
jgi:hypothetical protein